VGPVDRAQIDRFWGKRRADRELRVIRVPAVTRRPGGTALPVPVHLAAGTAFIAGARTAQRIMDG